ncbi:DUF1963 domain-containing protein [Lentzea sp. NPDC058436]|uniref:DUF1963 domain-containing protein n=1 Tax=Lentzea sp. NPDC058436 TaxID=3346499 RepID=UPI003649C720
MDRYEQFRLAAIDRGIPEDEIAVFADQLRFAIWLGTGDPDEQAVGQKGGLPRLPVGAEWPGSANGSPLPFIASIDCAALPRAEGLPLPADGSLLFFLHHEDDVEDEAHTSVPVHARALHVPAGTETAVASPPSDHDTRTFFHENIPFLLPEHPISAWIETALPKWISEEEYDFNSEVEERLFDDLKHVEQLRELVDELWPDSGRGATIRIGGYVSNIGGQDTPWTQMAYAGLTSQLDHPALPGQERLNRSEVEEYRLIREWLPLAQFYTTSEFYYGCFLISSDDLAGGHFDRMLSFTMFSE